ncbi:MAG: hypothetical protein ACK56I_04555, partial [bacterium]
RVAAARVVVVVHEAGEPSLRDDAEVADRLDASARRIKVRPHAVDRGGAERGRRGAGGGGHGDPREGGVYRDSDGEREQGGGAGEAHGSLGMNVFSWGALLGGLPAQPYSAREASFSQMG